MKHSSFFSVFLLCLLLLFLSKTATAQLEEQSSIGVFQFVAQSIDVVGLEDDVSYIVRNELRKKDNFNVINQRELEVALTRNEIEQIFSAAEAVKAATVLNLNYVIIGEVSRANQQITANVQVVSPIQSKSIGSLTFNFTNQAQIDLQAEYIGDQILAIIGQHKTDSQRIVETLDEDWVDSIKAVNNSGVVQLSWTMTNPSIEFLGFNVYRAESEQGPFSYITSEAETRASDVPGPQSATYFYQLSMIDGNGEEIRSDKLASVSIQAAVKSNIQPPTIMNVIERVNSVAVEFFPSAANVDKNIVGYELLRKDEGSDWQIVGNYIIPQTSSNNNRQQPNLTQLTLEDGRSSSINGPVSYSLRAFSNDEKGTVTQPFSYQPATAPQITMLSNATLRQIQLGWQSATAGFGYRLYRKVSDSDPFTLLAEIPNISTNSYIDTDIQQEGQSFRYAISVYDDFGETAKSDLLIAQSKGALEPPTELKGESGLVRAIKLSWLPVNDPDVKGYSIFRGPYTEDQEFTLNRIGEVMDPLASSFVDNSDLVDGTQYYYSVASINQFDVSGPVSKAVLVSTKQPPEALTEVSARFVDNQVEVNWMLPDSLSKQDIGLFVLERSFDGQNFNVLKELMNAQQSYIDGDLIAGATAVYRVKVTDVDGLQSAYTMSAPTKMSVPLILTNPEPGMLRQISLAWENAVSPAIIKVFRGLDENNLAQVSEVAGYSEPAYIDSDGLDDDTSYSVKIEAWLNDSKLAESNVINVQTKDIPAPQNLAVIAGLPNKIELTWDKVNDDSIKGYVIFRRESGNSQNQLLSIAIIDDVDQTRYTDIVTNGRVESVIAGVTSIKHGVEYEYAIASKNVFDATGYVSDIVKGASKPLPTTASAIQAMANEERVELSWQLGSETDLKQVIVERKWPFESEYSEISNVDARSNRYIDTDLYPYVTPSYRLTVVDIDGLKSLPSVISNIENVKGVSLNIEQDKLLRQIVINWTGSHPNVATVVNRRIAGEDNWQQLGTFSASTLKLSDQQGLTDQTNYEYQLKLQTNDSQAYPLGTSNIVQGSTKQLPDAPQLSATSGLVKAVKLDWAKANDPDVGGYNIYKVEDDGDLDKLETLSANETTFTDEGSFFNRLDDGANYNYKIASFNTFEVEGPKGELVSATTKPLPSIPQNLQAQLQGNSVELNWAANPETDIQDYEVYRGSSCSRVSKVGSTNSGTNYSYTDTDARAGRSYCYKVKAVDSTELESALSLGSEVSMPEETGQ